MGMILSMGKLHDLVSLRRLIHVDSCCLKKPNSRDHQSFDPQVWQNNRIQVLKEVNAKFRPSVILLHIE